MQIVKVHLGDRSYEIVVGNKILAQLGNFIRKRSSLTHSYAVVLTVPVVRRLFADQVQKALRKVGIHSFWIEVPDTEKSKSAQQYGRVLNHLLEISKGGRSFFLINLGGGVVGDLGGFVAATFKRGMPYVGVPTTLLAQVDSAIGGKTGIDLDRAKNMVGAFWQPALVVSDVSTLVTLPHREFLSGLAEVIKYGVIKEKDLFCCLENSSPKELQKDVKTLESIVLRCSQCKAKFVELDEKDQKGIRALLNFGHTLGHAIESATGYSNFYRHGEAISIGMVCATRMAMALDLTDENVLIRITRLLQKFGLPSQLDKKVSLRAVLRNYLFDKKFSKSQSRFVLPLNIGHAIVKEPIPHQLVREAIEGCRS